MPQRRLLGRSLLVVFALAAASCGREAPPEGPGWRLAETRSPTFNDQGITVDARAPGVLHVEVTVLGGGDGGCGAPSFSGFEWSRQVLIAVIDRKPKGGVCLVTQSVTFAVELQRRVIPAGVERIAVKELCSEPTCSREGEAIPVPVE